MDGSDIDNDLEEFDDFDPEIDPARMPTFDILNAHALSADLMAHILALEKILVWGGMATPDLLSEVVVQCRQDFDQQWAESRTQTLKKMYSPAQIRAWWQVKNKQDAIDNWK